MSRLNAPCALLYTRTNVNSLTPTLTHPFTLCPSLPAFLARARVRALSVCQTHDT